MTSFRKAATYGTPCTFGGTVPLAFSLLLLAAIASINTVAFQLTSNIRRPPSSSPAASCLSSRPFQTSTLHAKVPVKSTNELRRAVFDDGYELHQVELSNQLEAATAEEIEERQRHEVLRLMKRRFQNKSIPGNRTDGETLALAIEGGGMRGCVSAGMAAAIASLGLIDSIDVIYGSSAGSVIGSYMVSRQMCLDVYVDILPAAKQKFVSKRRLIASIAQSALQVATAGLRSGLNVTQDSTTRPGMNISFVLDCIMDEKDGLRPLDIEKFKENNILQPLRVVSSCIHPDGTLQSQCFGTKEFFGDHIASTQNGVPREGLFACLEASMTVPGATGPPVALDFGKGNATGLCCLDAFCFEPIPYRSAVEEGASHVLALCSRPSGFQPKTQPGAYERAVAPLYFYSHGEEEVAKFFEKGGQQFLYAEDLLILSEAKSRLNEPVTVAPPKVLYGHPSDVLMEAENRHDEWKDAYICPIQVPPETKELGTLEQGKDAVLEAVRGGYSEAFELLAPVVGIDLTELGISSAEAAELVFPEPLAETDGATMDLDTWLMETSIDVPGASIQDQGAGTRGKVDRSSTTMSSMQKRLFDRLPGFQMGQFAHLSKGLRYGSSLYEEEMRPSTRT